MCLTSRPAVQPTGLGKHIAAYSGIQGPTTNMAAVVQDLGVVRLQAVSKHSIVGPAGFHGARTMAITMPSPYVWPRRIEAYPESNQRPLYVHKRAEFA